MQNFDIYVEKGNVLRFRETREASSANAALRGYGLKGSRPRMGSAVSASGKRFHAFPEVTP